MNTINDLILAEIAFKPPVISVRNDNRYRPDFFIGYQIRELKICTNSVISPEYTDSLLKRKFYKILALMMTSYKL